MPKWKPLILWAVNHPQMHPLSFPWSPARPMARPPCTDAILHSGIQTVYVAGLDPNPRHAGNGIEILREKGLNVELASPDIQERAGRLNFIFNHNMQTGRPMIALKLAESANGKLADEAGRPSRVTESEARADMMHWRRLFPAICVGSGTVLADNPSLTARLPAKLFARSAWL